MKKQSQKPKEWQEYILPAVIKLGYQDIAVSEFSFLDGEQGAYSADAAKIRINEGMEGRELLNTLLHECLHAIVYTYGLKKDFKDDDEEEKLVNAFGNGLTELLVRNPEVVEFIRKTV